MADGDPGAFSTRAILARVGEHFLDFRFRDIVLVDMRLAASIK